VLKFKTILAPTDFSLPSKQALEVAASLAREHGAKLVIVHAIEPLPSHGEGQLVYSFSDTGVEEARQELLKVVPSDPSVTCEHKLVRGDAAAQILQSAAESSADLIVMGTHGRTWLSHLLMGSVAETVVRQARCPVLTVKQPAQATVSPGRIESSSAYPPIP
jgi:nucleotide-binding universal stress UspA family protein